MTKRDEGSLIKYFLLTRSFTFQGRRVEAQKLTTLKCLTLMFCTEKCLSNLQTSAEYEVISFCKVLATFLLASLASFSLMVPIIITLPLLEMFALTAGSLI